MEKVQTVRHVSPLWTMVRWIALALWVLIWPLLQIIKLFDKHYVAYFTGRILRDADRIYSIKFIWYGDAVYLHPMIWGSLALYFAAIWSVAAPGWLLLMWFVLLTVCFLTIMYNFNVIKSSILGIGLVALFGLAYFSTVEFAWNPLAAVARHIASLEAVVTPGFYQVSAYVFTLLIISEIVWAWLFHRVEIDESYVYEHLFLQGTTREPIFARGLKRETKDLLELLLLGAADIQHRTKSGSKRFKNVPFASLWLGTAFDSLLDYRRKGQVELERSMRDASDQARISDAIAEESDDWDGQQADDQADDVQMEAEEGFEESEDSF